uniref:ParB/RepB/Spo0J family partition protein n=1 Tax=Streptomyces achromogenes TaxID=67255 RepID=UPI003F494CF9
MTAPRKPMRNKGGGKLNQERAKAGVDVPNPGPSGIHTLDPEDGELFEHDPADISPNPMNQRLGLGNIDELVDSVQRQGVHTPGAVMHTDLFMEMYPEWADQVPHPDRTYILGPGHRRREAALKAGKPMLVILRDKWAKERTVEENLISENKDRENLTPIEQALQLDLLRRRGLTGEQIAERAGYGSRGSVTRILNLLDLPQEIQDSIHAGSTSPKAGYTLSTIKDDQDDNSSEAAHALQLKAFGWMRDEKITAEAAKNRLKLEATVFPAGNTKSIRSAPVDDTSETSGSDGDVSREKHGQEQGTEQAGPSGQQQSETPIPHQTSGDNAVDGKPSDENKSEEPAEDRSRLLAAAEAAEQRDLACRLILSEERYAGAPEVNALLVNAVLNPKEWKEASARAHEWLRDLGKGPKAGRASAYFDAVAAEGDVNLKRRAAFAIALAANEVRASRTGREWDERDRAHLKFLITSKVAYQPTEYEQELLGLSPQEAK